MNKLKVMSVGALAAVVLSGCSSAPDFDDLVNCESSDQIPHASIYAHKVTVSYKDEKVWTVNMISELNNPAMLSNKTVQKYISEIDSNGKAIPSEVEYGVDARIGVVSGDFGVKGSANIVNSELVSMHKSETGVELPETRTQEIMTNFDGTDVQLDMSSAQDGSLIAHIKTCKLDKEKWSSN
ncbi:hypothetical protein [Vibrio owensii]|uniref:hypothetical protein n=1 Tax=Vibrio harveyi group TaxID=717610 RepID=UPI003CC6B009